MGETVGQFEIPVQCSSYNNAQFEGPIAEFLSETNGDYLCVAEWENQVYGKDQGPDKLNLGTLNLLICSSSEKSFNHNIFRFYSCENRPRFNKNDYSNRHALKKSKVSDEFYDTYHYKFFTRVEDPISALIIDTVYGKITGNIIYKVQPNPDRAQSNPAVPLRATWKVLSSEDERNISKRMDAEKQAELDETLTEMALYYDKMGSYSISLFKEYILNISTTSSKTIVDNTNKLLSFIRSAPNISIFIAKFRLSGFINELEKNIDDDKKLKSIISDQVVKFRENREFYYDMREDIYYMNAGLDYFLEELE